FFLLAKHRPCISVYASTLFSLAVLRHLSGNLHGDVVVAVGVNDGLNLALDVGHLSVFDFDGLDGTALDVRVGGILVGFLLGSVFLLQVLLCVLSILHVACEYVNVSSWLAWRLLVRPSQEFSCSR